MTSGVAVRTFGVCLATLRSPSLATHTGRKRASESLSHRVRFTPESRHSERDSVSAPYQCPLNPRKQTLERVSLNVCF